MYYFEDDINFFLSTFMKVLLPEYFEKSKPENQEQLYLAQRKSQIKANFLRILRASDIESDNTYETEFDNLWECRLRIRSLLIKDIDAFFDGDPAADSKREIALIYPGFYAIAIYRLAHSIHKLGIKMIPRMLTEYAHRKTGIDIHPAAEINESFFIDHGTGVVIGGTTIIGKNVKIYQGVTLGAISTRGGQQLKNVKRHPTIKDNVTIYAGAYILGGETVIGKGSVIGGNTVVMKSCPENTILINETKPRKISK